MRYKILLSIVLIASFYFVSKTEATPLDDYVYAPDPHYGFELLKTYEMPTYTLYILNFTSQKWYDETVLDRPIWWHYLCITIPNKITKPDVGYLLIDGGSNTASIPKPTDNPVDLTSVFAASTGSIGACLKDVPNQPIVFKKDPTQQSRTEDAVIAWTWSEFLKNTSDPYILLRMPMTKAAVRAMDAITEFARQKGVANITKFTVAGASKRGWTTWTTAAVAKDRVMAAIPIVMDLLNINENLHHHYRSLGAWTFPFDSYHVLNITRNLDTPEMFAMQQIIDPYYYLDRYEKIKFLVMNCAGDEFFLPDDNEFFWTNLRTATNGSALMRKIPNAEHSLAGHETSIFFSMRSFFLSIYNKQNLPSVTWTKPNNVTHGMIVVTVDILNGPAPSDVTIYYAKTLDNKRRDFRLLVGDPNNPGKPMVHPVIWLENKKIIRMKQTANSIIYTAAILKPMDSWIGFYFQLTFPGLENTELQVTSEVNIIPETYPFDDCYRESCLGELV